MKEEAAWPPPPKGQPEQSRPEAKPVNRGLGPTAFCFSGSGTLAWLIIRSVDVYAINEGGWIILLFGGLASLLSGLVIGLMARRSFWGKSGLAISLLTLLWPLADLYRHPFYH